MLTLLDENARDRVAYGYIQEIAESLQRVKHKGESHSSVRTLGMGDATGHCRIFVTCNPFQRF